MHKILIIWRKFSLVINILNLWQPWLNSRVNTITLKSNSIAKSWWLGMSVRGLQKESNFWISVVRKKTHHTSFNVSAYNPVSCWPGENRKSWKAGHAYPFLQTRCASSALEHENFSFPIVDLYNLPLRVLRFLQFKPHDESYIINFP